MEELSRPAKRQTPNASRHPTPESFFMSNREFDLTIHPDGRVEVHVKGFPGKACLEAAKFFEETVGEMLTQQATHELYEPEEQVQYRLENRR
jgi:hypothetical protein